MTPEQKAREIVYDYIDAYFNCKDCNNMYCSSLCTMLTLEESKECARIAVSYIRDVIPIASYIQEYWREVEEKIKDVTI
jgi:hypothetical protein